MSNTASLRMIGRDPAHPHLRHPAAVWGQRLLLLIVAIWIAGVALGFINALVLLTLVGFVAAIAGLHVPVLGLFGVGLLTVLDPVTRHLLLGTGGLLRWNSFNYWLVIVMLLYLPRIWRLSDPHSRLLRLLILVLLIDLALAPRWTGGLQNLLNVSTVFGLLIYFQRTRRDVETLFWLGVVMSVTAAIGGLEFFRQGRLLSQTNQTALAEMNKNAFSMFPLAGLLGACLAFPAAGRLYGGQLLLTGLAAIDLTWVFLSRSRGSLVVALIAMTFLIASARTLATRLVYVAMAALVTLGAVGAFGALETNATARLDKLLDANVSLEERTSGRAGIARGGWQIFLRNPLGVGTGGFEDAWSELEFVGTTNHRQGMLVPAHSAWIMVLAENGLPGILLFTAYVASFAFAGLRRRDAHLLALGLFVTAMLTAAFTTNEFQSKALWFVAAGAAALLQPQAPQAAARARAAAPRRARARPRPLVTPVVADA